MMFEIDVYSYQDCNDLCAILARNGYYAIAYELCTNMSSSAKPKNWKIQYYDPKEISVDNIKTDGYNLEGGIIYK